MFFISMRKISLALLSIRIKFFLTVTYKLFFAGMADYRSTFLQYRMKQKTKLQTYFWNEVIRRQLS